MRGANTTSRHVRLPTGVRDHLPRAAARRRAIGDAIISTFENWGYERILTPVIEVASVLERGLSEGERPNVVRFVEPMTGDILALRPDITPQIARIAATRLELGVVPERFCYEGPVIRLSGGGQREQVQAGIELIGPGGARADGEAIALALAALAATRVPRVRLDIGHVAFSRFALDHCPAANRDDLKVGLARKDRAGVARIAESMPAAVGTVVAELPLLFGEGHDVLASAKAMKLPRELRGAVDEVESLLSDCTEQSADTTRSSISVDLGDVRGFDYYTGIRFRGFVDGVGQAVLRGGRYDDLVGRFGRPAPATGFAIDVEAIAEALETARVELSYVPLTVFVVVSPARRATAARLASMLREDGVAVAVHFHGPDEDVGAVVREYSADVGQMVLRRDEVEGWQIVAEGRVLLNVEDAVADAVRGNGRSLLSALRRA